MLGAFRLLVLSASAMVLGACLDWPELGRGFAHVPSEVVAGTGELVIDQDTHINTGETPTITRDGTPWPLPAGVEFQVVSSNQGTALAVLKVGSLKVEGDPTLRVTGPRPLVVLAATDIEILGTVDAGGIGGESGPGSSTETGNSVVAAVGIDEVSQYYSGASGGGNLEPGGRGGDSLKNAVLTVGPEGGPPSNNTGGELLVGGGPGGGGANSNCFGGGGGGALQLSAGGRIRLAPDGRIRVSGGGGAGGCLCDPSGGAGGGAGGILYLQARSFEHNGQLAASGGGGGGGCTGQPSNEPVLQGDDGGFDSTPTPGAPGDRGDGGDGGNGGAGNSPPDGGETNEWGGGGGGARGYIFVVGERSGIGVSSPPIREP